METQPWVIKTNDKGLMDNKKLLIILYLALKLNYSLNWPHSRKFSADCYREGV